MLNSNLWCAFLAIFTRSIAIGECVNSTDDDVASIESADRIVIHETAK